ncbi:hypothetical protein WJX84_009734 [Apatococcus fuscideae]|uniref:Magnesium-dependent phosphatase 1 n=1 Tax=Apatococcus fuscideae TaxID=2026836 RepID=A0AAW1STV7_9CHLO
MRSSDDRPGTADRATAILKAAERRPKLVVFDLDYTIWPYWCEMMSPRDDPYLFPEARGVMQALEDEGISMAIASRTPTPKTAKAFLQKLGLTDKFVSTQLIPASSGFDMDGAAKDKHHLPNIHKETGVPYSEMIFFDDESPNVQKVSRLGVCSILVRTSTGVSLDELKRALDQFARQK